MQHIMLVPAILIIILSVLTIILAFPMGVINISGIPNSYKSLLRLYMVSIIMYTCWVWYGFDREHPDYTLVFCQGLNLMSSIVMIIQLLRIRKTS